MTKIEVFKAGGYMTDREEYLRGQLSCDALDGLAAAAIFGRGDPFISLDNHFVVASDPIPEGRGKRVVAAMAIGPSWLNDDASSKVLSIRSYLLPHFAIDSPDAPGRFGAMARAARRSIDRRAMGIGLVGFGDSVSVDKAEERFRRLATGVNENPNAIEARIDRTIEEDLGQAALTAVVRFPRPFADIIHGIPNPLTDIRRALPEVHLPDRRLIPA